MGCDSNAIHSPAHSRSSMSAEIPLEIWQEILHFLDVEHVLLLERTCRPLRDVIASRHFWLKRLQLLDQEHAPDLPPHVNVDSLACHELRDLVVRARRRVLNCTGSSTLRVSREVVIPIDQGNMNGIFDQPLGWGADTLLVPGGRYFLLKWPTGYLQCWDVATKDCMWTYPSISRNVPDTSRVLSRCCFACDVQTNGHVHVSVVSETQGVDERTLEVLGFSKEEPLSLLYQAKPSELDVLHGLAVIMKLCGNVVIVYTEGNVIVTFWRENRSVVITQGIFDALEILNDYIIGITGFYEGSSLVSIPLPVLYRAAATHVKLEDVVESSCPITPPPHWLFGRAQFSTCKFHWRGSRQGKVMITVFGDVYDEQNSCDFPMAEFFSFGVDNIDALHTTDSLPTFTSLGRSRVTYFEPQFSTYSIISPPSQSGSTVIAFHDDRNHEVRFARVLAVFAHGKEATIRRLDDAVVQGKPATFSLNVEFYSGAIYYVTQDLSTVVIRYID